MAKKDALGKTLKNLYITMLRIRKAQEKISELYPQGKMRCPVHLYTGEEAIAAGVCANLLPTDLVFSYYRSHGHYLAKGGSLKGLFAELYGKETGCSKGRGGSMHLIDIKNGFMGTSAIVGGPIPLAVGAALGFKLRGENSRVAVAFFGDGACEEGVWHESMNFASLKKLPVLFVCENNLYAVKSHIATRQAGADIWKRAKNYGIESIKVNGNNVLKVWAAARSALKLCKKGKGPILIETETYRWRGHLENTFNKDVFEGRPKEEVEAWMARCPIKALEDLFFLRNGWPLKKAELEKIGDDIDREINEAVKFAEESPFPDNTELGE